MPVRRRLGHDIGGDHPAGAAPVVHDHGLAEAAPDRLHDHARREIVAPARLRGHDTYRPARVVLPAHGGNPRDQAKGNKCNKTRHAHRVIRIFVFRVFVSRLCG